MNSAVKFLKGITFSFLLLFGLQLAQAQTNQGQIAGNVVDSTGAAVPNATITAKSESNGAVYNAVSSGSGSYRFPSIQLGRYTVTVSAPGFKSSESTGLEVRVGTVSALDVTLGTGGNTETVTVAANAPAIETESSDIGGTVNSRQIIDLPLALGGVGAMRSPESFVFLIPGTAGPGSGNSVNGVFTSKIGGGQNFGAEVLLDGASQTRSENGSSFDEEAPSVEAISEFKVTTSVPAAEFGRTTGGIENFVIKSGTNAFHGSAFGIFQNEFLNANDWFNNGRKAYYQSIGDTLDANNNRRPAGKQYDFGISAGGPLSIPHLYNGKDKTFGFFSWEQYRRTQGGVVTSTVPTAAERNGDFSDRLINGTNNTINPCDGTPILNGQIFDPATTRTVGQIRCRTAFPGNVIPTARFSAVGSNIAAFYPTPTNGALTNNYTLSSSSPVFNTTYTIRVDHSIGSNDKIFGSYSSRENTRRNPPFLTLPAPVDPGVQTQDFITHFGRAGWDHIFTQNILNHLNLGFNRSNSINGSIQSGSSTNYNPQLGTPFTAGFPRVIVGGPAGGLNGNGSSDPQGGYQTLSRNQNSDYVDNGVRVNDSVSWQKGRNSFKAGIDYRYQQFSGLANDQTNGYLSFQNAETQATQSGGFQNGTGNSFASLLLGAGDNAQSTVPAHQPRWISSYWAGFLQDDLKVSQNLILNLGIRYDVDKPRHEAQNNTSNFSLTDIDPKNGLPGAMVFGTTCTNCNKRWADTWYKDIAPRIGFAYTPSAQHGTFVIRGGFAVLYGPLQYTDFGGSTITGYSVQTQQNSNGFDPAFALDGGVTTPTAGTDLDPAFFDNGNANAARPVTGSYIASSYGRPGQINQWNLQVQQELAKDLIMTLGYIGSSGAHLRSGVQNINNIPIANFARGDGLVSYDLAGNGLNSPYAAFNGNVQQRLRPFPQYGYIATDCCLQNVGHSSYDALIASIERRFTGGLNLQASYTWSKTITNADSLLPGDNGGINQEQNPFDSKSQKALSIQDIPNTFVVSYLYELPFGQNKPFLNFGNPIARSLISGFEIGGVQRYQSGQPISFQGATGIPGWDNFIAYDRIPGSSLASPARHGKIDPFRSLKAGGSVTGPDPNVDSEFNGIAFPNGENAGYSALQTAPAFVDQNDNRNRQLRAVVTTGPAADNGGYQFGDVPRVTSEFRNYRYVNEDFSVLKKTPISEGTTLFLKIELLNAFNRHIFSTPNDNIFNQPGNVGFGVPTGVLNASQPGFSRVIQLTGRIQF